LVQRVVLHGGADKPRALCGFDERASSDGDFDWACAWAAVDVVICGPAWGEGWVSGALGVRVLVGRWK
jgi:hypothetical protein